jgi:signal transduction histidine kinase/CheY-like chemotaxis protein
MPKANLPSNEDARLEAVRHLDILDTKPEEVFDQLTILAAQICEAPYAALSLIDRNRQWFKSRVGLEVSEMPRDMAVCAHTILQDNPLIISDLKCDERFADNPMILASFRFYAGVPLRTQDGHALGSFCVLDVTPRELKPSQIAALETLARHVSAQLEERRILRTLYAHVRNVSDMNVEKAPADSRITSVPSADPQHIARELEAALSGRDQVEVALRRVENELREAQTQEVIGRLASGIAHDVNNMLAVVLGNAELMAHRLEADHPQRKSVRAIIEAAKRGGTLTQQILTFGKRQMQRPGEVDLHAAVGESVGLLKNLGRDSVQITFDAEPDLRRVRLDRSQLGQIVVNLGLNALDAMPDGGDLVISLCNREGAGLASGELDGPFVMLSIRDNGCGMDEQTLVRARDSFFSTKTSGTGLGLSTVQSIVDQCGGVFHIDSCQGEGTTFEIYFPCATAETASGQTVTHKTVARTEPATVMLVEDDHSVRQLIVDCLCTAGHRVLEAEHGEAAMGITAEHNAPIDLLVTDVGLPGMSGGELARRMRARHLELAVLFISAASNDARVSDEVTTQRAGFLQKPFSMDVFRCAVDHALSATSKPMKPQPSSVG